MSKFLKFIVHLIVICAIICVLGLTIPPFFGVNTVVVDDPAMKTNLPMGSVTYAIPEKSAEVIVGEPILVREDAGTYRYEIQSLNLETGLGTVIDPSVTNGKEITVAVKEYVPKVVLTLGYVGYLQVATKSMEGLIILGLAVVFLIILYVIAELWKKDDRKFAEDPAGEDALEYVRSARELKREEKERMRRMKAEDDQIAEEMQEAGRKKKKEKRVVRTGGFVDEIDAMDDEDEYDVPEQSTGPAVSEAHELLKKEIAAATAGVGDYERREARRAGKAKAKAAEEMADADEEAYDEPEDDVRVARETRRRVISGYTPQELAQKAKAQGDDPDVVKDDVTEITLFDYSDILDGSMEDGSGEE